MENRWKMEELFLSQTYEICCIDLIKNQLDY